MRLEPRRGIHVRLDGFASDGGNRELWLRIYHQARSEGGRLGPVGMIGGREFELERMLTKRRCWHPRFGPLWIIINAGCTYGDTYRAAVPSKILDVRPEFRLGRFVALSAAQHVHLPEIKGGRNEFVIPGGYLAAIADRIVQGATLGPGEAMGPQNRW